MMEMEEQQENKWKEQMKEHMVKELASTGTQSAPEIRARMRSVGIQSLPDVRAQEAQSSTDVRTSEAQTMPELRTQLRSERGMASETNPYTYSTQLRSERGMGSLCGMHKARRLDQALQKGLGYPPRASWSFGVFGMKGLKWVRGG